MCSLSIFKLFGNKTSKLFGKIMYILHFSYKANKMSSVHVTKRNMTDESIEAEWRTEAEGN